MKLTKSMAKMWQIDVTSISQLEKYEKQGYDVSEFKAAALAKAQSNVDATAVARGLVSADAVTLDNPIMLEKLTPHISAPRDLADPILKDSAGLLGNKNALVSAPLVYGAVVQAHHVLWKPGSFKATAVLVIAADEAHRNDITWLTNVADRISQMKGGVGVPPDMEKLIKSLRVGGGYFCEKIGASLAEDACAWCGVMDINQKLLPKTYIPSIKIIPFFLTKEPSATASLCGKLIPAKYYV
jgi:hypothetical protein